MSLTRFADRFAGTSGISELMDDIGEALRRNPDTVFMGGGNPARVPAVEALCRARLGALVADPELWHRAIGTYQIPQGDLPFREALAAMLRREYGWNLSAANIAISNGSQSAFFVLFNLFAGQRMDGSNAEVLLPFVPEYIGYRDIGLAGGIFRAARPAIERLPDMLFKYRVDFANVQPTANTGAICVSRPTNPTGNVLSDAEVASLDRLARAHGVPLIVDGAYGTPFPEMLFAPATPHWNENTILVLSLSKLGLPGLRTGIIVANEAVVRDYSRAMTILSLACGSVGPALGVELLRDDALLRLSREAIRPFYADKAARSLDALRDALAGLPVRIHKPEGAMFLWLWFEGLAGGTRALYERLKQEGVLVVPGEGFFMGLDAPWAHSTECLRVSYAQPDERVRQGIEIIGRVAREAYGG